MLSVVLQHDNIGNPPEPYGSSRNPRSITGVTLSQPFPPLVIERADPRSWEAADLIQRLTNELRTRYDDLDDGTGNFNVEDVLVPGAAFLLGRVEGKAVACAALRPVTPAIGEIKRVFVATEVRGRRYGRTMLAEIERLAVEFGYRKLRLETGTRQPESLRLYETSGYHCIPNFEPYVESHWSVCFEKSLVAD